MDIVSSLVLWGLEWACRLCVARLREDRDQDSGDLAS
jgi:hypothetical protein